MGALAGIRALLDRWRRPLPLGKRGELAAAKFLRRKGYLIVAQGERRGVGEIDLVAVDQRTVVFVEVKTRRTHDAGHPLEAVDANKQKRLTRIALSYLRRHELLENPARFDVVGITWPDDRSPPVIEHFRNAFEPVGHGQMFG